MQWIVLALLVALFYGAYNFLIKLSSTHIHQMAGAVILQLIALLLGVAGLVYLKANDYPVEVTRDGVRYSVAAGVFVGLAEILSFYVFSLGTSASRGIPIIIGGSIVVGALLGWSILREEMKVSDWVGIVLIAGGVVVLTMRERAH